MTLRGRGSLWGLVLQFVEGSCTPIAWSWRLAFQLEGNVNGFFLSMDGALCMVP